MDLILEALDSHAYWQLSDKEYRNNGYVMGQGANDEESRLALKATNALYQKLNEVLGRLDCSLLAE